ncbi:hypothetical protein LINGRAPRIM_LOCUS2552 [Linum grandiflorum]
MDSKRPHHYRRDRLRRPVPSLVHRSARLDCWPHCSLPILLRNLLYLRPPRRL